MHQKYKFKTIYTNNTRGIEQIKYIFHVQILTGKKECSRRLISFRTKRDDGMNDRTTYLVRMHT